MHRDPRCPTAELRQKRRQDVRAGGQDPEVQRSVVALLQRVHLLGEQAEPTLHVIGSGKCPLAGRGDLELAADAIEGGRAEHLLQLLDLLRDGRTRHK